MIKRNFPTGQVYSKKQTWVMANQHTFKSRLIRYIFHYELLITSFDTIISAYFFAVRVWTLKDDTAWKMSVFGVILVRIFPHSEWIQRDTPYLPVFRLNAGNTDQNNSEYGHFLRSLKPKHPDKSSYRKKQLQNAQNFHSRNLVHY